jgi:adenylate cyclase class 1
VADAALQDPHPPTRKSIARLLARHQAVARERLGHIHDTLTHEQSRFLELLPLLLHVNHPALPGFAGSDTPAGISGYEPDRNALLAARQHTRSLKRARRPQRYPPLLGLYLIGSSGTLGQDRRSDFDFWVCHHPALDAAQRDRLSHKTQLLEQHARQLGLSFHFFLLHAEGFRHGQHSHLSDESSGGTQHHLLLEEFYRTGLLLAGRPPLWWIVPPERLHEYRDYCDHLLHRRFIRGDEWLDFGGLARVSPGEFFSAAHWQLFKGIQAPYKSLLKLMLFETYAEAFPDIRWLAEEVQAVYHGAEPPAASDVDPYLLLLRRVEGHLSEQPQRLRLARRALYLKSGVQLSRRVENWKDHLLKDLVTRWAWDKGELINLDRHRQWKLPRIVEERNQLVGELSGSYRLLTHLARRHDALGQIDMHELALLGRKLFSALERRPGKIDRVNPDLSDDLHEPEVWLRRDPHGHHWQCHLLPPDEDTEPIRQAAGIVELLLWLTANGVIDSSTRIDIPKDQQGASENEHRRLLKVLLRHFPGGDLNQPPLERFEHAAHGEKALLVANALQPVRIPRHGHLTVSERADPLSFGSQRLNLVARLEHVHRNSWGELHVTQHAGSEGVLDMLCHHLELFHAADMVPSTPCHCDTPGHGSSIALRLSHLLETLPAHFRQHGRDARYILQIGEIHHLIDHHRGRFDHHPLGDLEALLAFLGESDGRFHPTRIDAAGLRRDSLPRVMRLNRRGRIQVCYRCTAHGIQYDLLDSDGAMLRLHTPQTSEARFLTQQQGFFDTLQDWLHPFPGESGPPPLEFLRLRREDEDWVAQRVSPPPPSGHPGTELILSTGARGPWRDGFSLISGRHEFNSVALGEHLYPEVAHYLRSLREGRDAYPFHLSGVLITDPVREGGFSLLDLMRFKVRVEQRLNQA